MRVFVLARLQPRHETNALDLLLKGIVHPDEYFFPFHFGPSGPSGPYGDDSCFDSRLQLFLNGVRMSKATDSHQELDAASIQDRRRQDIDARIRSIRKTILRPIVPVRIRSGHVLHGTRYYRDSKPTGAHSK